MLAYIQWKQEGIFRIDSENRNSTEFPTFSDSAWFAGTYQQQMREALCDNAPLSITAKVRYFWLSNGFLSVVQRHLYSFSDYYVHFRKGIWLYGDHDRPNLLYRNPIDSNSRFDTLRMRASRINDAALANPSVSFYIYYVTRESDFLFESNSFAHYFDTLKTHLSLSPSHVTQLQLNGFQDFRKSFFRTDHHWNQFGAYQGYKDIFQMLQLEVQGETLNTPFVSDSILLSPVYTGSKSHSIGTPWKFSEDFFVYRFDLLPMHITLNGEDFEYGHPEPDLWTTYGKVFGKDKGELVFSTGRIDRPNIIIIADSYDNPILKLIASHFNKTYSIDLRHYKAQVGKPFCLNDYIREHDVSVVLFVGNLGMYITEEWNAF